MSKTITNETTKAILNFLFRSGVFCWRQNVAPIPISRNGTVTGFRSGGKSGLPDIMGVLQPIGNRMDLKGTYLGVEIKTGKDRLSEVQKSFHLQVKQMGGIIFVVKDFNDFLLQWQNFLKG